MKKLIIAALILSLGSCTHTSEPLVHEVNPFIGTDGPGNVYPGAQAPFGMVQLSPDNGTSGWDRIAGYFWPDTTIAGFSHTHLSGTGAGDLYDISFMPAVKPYKIGSPELGLYSTFTHQNESAWASYYQVHLSDYKINVELTATPHCGIQRYTFPDSDSALVRLDLAKHMNWDYAMGSMIKVIDNQTIEGYRYSEGWAPDQKVYFTTRFSKPFVHSQIDTIYTQHPQPQYNGLPNAIGSFYFHTKEGEQVEVTTAISGVSIQGAWANFEVEVANKNFEELRRSTEKSWEAELGKIAIKGGTPDQRVTFYTALYRTMLAPTLYSDVNGDYRGADKQLYQSPQATYSTFSLWDTYRAEHPLLTFLHPDKVTDMVASFLDFADQSGALPVWNMWSCETDMMIGNHAIPVIAEAYLKGIPMDTNRALDAMVKSAERSNYRNLEEFNKLNFVPANLAEESVSKTLEYAYDAYCIAVMARKMGRTEVEKKFLQRSKSYLEVFNAQSGFFQPKDLDQRWVTNFDPGQYSHHFTESNAWHYRFLQHDIAQQIELVGTQRFESALDSMFTCGPAPTDSLPIFSTGMIGQYAHGNEPSHHVAYLYNHIARPDKTRQYVTQIMNSQYANTPDGLCGNEDCGQMSAWYIFSAMGFYPVDPVSLKYELGVPLFDQIIMTLPQNKQFTVKKSRSDTNKTTINLNGTELAKPFITWEQIIAGGTLEFKIADK